MDERTRLDLLETARTYFREGRMDRCESILQQLLALPQDETPKVEHAEMWHMLAVISYDRGKFSRAIKTFRRALEIDPTYTDASLGLSILLNDIGRYEEGRQVFLDAEAALAKKNFDEDHVLKERLAAKHEELADLYLTHNKWDDAIEQLKLALEIFPKRVDFRLKRVEALERKGEIGTAFREIRQIVQENSQHHEARLKFGLMLFKAKRVADAIDQWETILLRDPDHPGARDCIRRAREAEESLSEL
ncbi:MAG TPA: tetratricopeptide repeat protein [Pseudobdellovibrionaceae bacterium]|nr:tetratricopeptide repeat protein [Pseudobdellovibrionaceae bacterium]